MSSHICEGDCKNPFTKAQSWSSKKTISSLTQGKPRIKVTEWKSNMQMTQNLFSASKSSTCAVVIQLCSWRQYSLKDLVHVKKVESTQLYFRYRVVTKHLTLTFTLWTTSKTRQDKTTLFYQGSPVSCKAGILRALGSIKITYKHLQ